eukprot:6246086-Prymnesium_polylepis.1
MKHRVRWRFFVLCYAFTAYSCTGDCVLTIKRTESGCPNTHNNADTRDTWPCYWQVPSDDERLLSYFVLLTDEEPRTLIPTERSPGSLSQKGEARGRRYGCHVARGSVRGRGSCVRAR